MGDQENYPEPPEPPDSPLPQREPPEPQEPPRKEPPPPEPLSDPPDPEKWPEDDIAHTRTKIQPDHYPKVGGGKCQTLVALWESEERREERAA